MRVDSFLESGRILLVTVGWSNANIRFALEHVVIKFYFLALTLLHIAITSIGELMQVATRASDYWVSGASHYTVHDQASIVCQTSRHFLSIVVTTRRGKSTTMLVRLDDWVVTKMHTRVRCGWLVSDHPWSRCRLVALYWQVLTCWCPSEGESWKIILFLLDLGCCR